MRMKRAWMIGRITVMAGMKEDNPCLPCPQESPYLLPLTATAYDSPDFNRIERCWSWLKSRIRKKLDQFECLRDAMEHVLHLAS